MIAEEEASPIFLHHARQDGRKGPRMADEGRQRRRRGSSGLTRWRALFRVCRHCELRGFRHSSELNNTFDTALEIGEGGWKLTADARCKETQACVLPGPLIQGIYTP